jgi:hypothetical protein
MPALACLGTILFVVVGSTIAYIVNGLVLSVLWGWFIVPLFNAPPLSITYAVGISLIAGMLTHQSQHKSDDKSSTGEALINAFSTSLITPLLILLVGWIVQMFL